MVLMVSAGHRVIDSGLVCSGWRLKWNCSVVTDCVCSCGSLLFCQCRTKFLKSLGPLASVLAQTGCILYNSTDIVQSYIFQQPHFNSTQFTDILISFASLFVSSWKGLVNVEAFSILYFYQIRLSHRDVDKITLVPFLTLKLHPYSFLFRQYKDKEEEHQSGFFSALTNMVSKEAVFFYS